MSYSRQTGHTLSVVMIIMILFALLSLTALRNGLIDRKIAQTFWSYQINEERQLSALRYFESLVLADLLNPESELYRRFQLTDEENTLELTLPIRSALGIERTSVDGEFDDPLIELNAVNPAAAAAAQSILIRAAILAPRTGRQLKAVYEIQLDRDSGLPDYSTATRLSVRKS